jgi:hypothetical protein
VTTVLFLPHRRLSFGRAHAPVNRPEMPISTGRATRVDPIDILRRSHIAAWRELLARSSNSTVRRPITKGLLRSDLV